MGVDASEVNRLRLDLSRAPARVQRRVPKVMQVAANKVKKGMRSDLKEGMSAFGVTSVPHAPSKITYDKTGRFDYEIGFEKEGQGNLGHFLAFGSPTSAPIFDHTAALRREVPHVLRALADAGEESVLGDG